MTRCFRGGIVLVGLALVTVGLAIAHPGGLDGQGGHNEKKAGTYHFHRGPLAGSTFSSKADAAAALAAQGQETEPAPKNLAPSLGVPDTDARLRALINVLERKGVLTASEIEQEMRTLSAR